MPTDDTPPTPQETASLEAGLAAERTMREKAEDALKESMENELRAVQRMFDARSEARSNGLIFDLMAERIDARLTTIPRGAASEAIIARLAAAEEAIRVKDAALKEVLGNDTELGLFSLGIKTEMDPGWACDEAFKIEEKIRAALALTPAAAVERERVMREVVEKALRWKVAADTGGECDQWDACTDLMATTGKLAALDATRHKPVKGDQP